MARMSHADVTTPARFVEAKTSRAGVSFKPDEFAPVFVTDKMN
jgi:hypothetical protein